MSSYSILRRARYANWRKLAIWWFVFGAGLIVGSAAPPVAGLFMVANIVLAVAFSLYVVYLLWDFHREFGLATVFGGDS